MSSITKRIFFFSLIITNFSYSQEYTFSEIKETLLRERPQNGDIILRNSCFSGIDYNVVDTYPPLNPEIYPFYKFMLKKAILEIKLENVTAGATIWQIYNHGFIIKTPSTTFGIDLNDFYETGILMELVNILDACFISHEHSDHIAPEFITEMNRLNKPVIGPVEIPTIPIGMAAGDSLIVASLSIVAHDGLHSDPVRQFEIVTPNGLKFLHTGDNQDTKTLPDVNEVDVMMLNAWINESGKELYSNTVPIAIDKVKPQVTLPGHILEMGHLVYDFQGSKILYKVVSVIDDGNLASDYYVLAWGERYHFDDTSDDTIRPNQVGNLSYEVKSDSVFVSWDKPQTAPDGDEASFFRIIVNDLDDFLVTESEYLYIWDKPGTYNIKVYAYDDCGNQSENYTEINVPIIGNSLRINPKYNEIIIGNEPTFDIIIDNISNLGSFQFDIMFDANIIQINDIIIGDFFGSTGRTVSINQSDINNTTGTLSLEVTSSGSDVGANGSGKLASINYTAQSVGSSTLEIQDAQILDINNQSLDLNLKIPGFVEVIPSPNWISQSSGVDIWFNCVNAVSEDVAWIAGRNSTILRTIDGGINWDYRWTGPDDINFWSIYGMDSDNALVTGTSGVWSEGTNVTYIFRTDDGGATWEKVFERLLGFIDDVTMFNQSVGYAIGGEIDGKFLFLKTTDGGHNWEYHPNAPIAQSGEFPQNSAIEWIDETTCWFGTSQSRILNTTDGGNTWNIIDSPLGENTTTVFDKNGIGLSASDFQLVRTFDYGNTWETVGLPSFSSIWHLINHQNSLWALSWKSIFSSIDNGSTWEKQMSVDTPKARYRYVSFITNESGTFGWAVGNFGVIAKYTNSDSSVDIETEIRIPEQFLLYDNYPNPFNPTTNIKFSIPKDEHVKIDIYNILGQHIETLIEEEKLAGVHQISYEPINLVSGVYLIRMIAGDFQKTNKMIYLK